MRKIVDLALAAGVTLAVIAPALADPQLPTECLELDRLRATANTLHALADAFQARLREVEAEESKYFARFDAEKTITLSGTVKEFQFRAPRAEIILNVVNGEAQPATWMIEMNSPAGLLRLGLDVEDTRARHTDHTDDPSAAGRLKWWPIPDRDAA